MTPRQDSPGTLVTFDYEGAWGMPYDCAYDQDAATGRILAVLAAHGVRAMFFFVGQLVLDRPDLVELVHGQGHAIGVHGFRHEHLDTLSPRALAAVGPDLAQVCEKVRRVTGYAPTAFRAPHLLGPVFVSEQLDAILAGLGFTWTSNREIRYPEEIFRPDRVRAQAPWRWWQRLGAHDPSRPLGALALVALNAGHLRRDPGLGLNPSSARWLVRHRGPLVRGSGLLDVPLASPLDCDLLGLPRPSEPSPQEMVDYAASCIGLGAQRGGVLYNANFHDWVIGTANRPEVLDRALALIAQNGRFLDGRQWSPSQSPSQAP